MAVYTLDEKFKRNASKPSTSPSSRLPIRSNTLRTTQLTPQPRLPRLPAPGRLLAATASFYTCTKTAHGTSLHALLGLFLAAGGVLNALAVGLGDGNAVDLEDRERERRRAGAAVARERRRVEGAKEKTE